MPIDPEEKQLISEKIIPLLERLINRERSKIRIFTMFGFFFLTIGTIGTLVTSNYWEETKSFGPYGFIITVLISIFFLGSVPLRWNLIGGCRYLKEKFEKIIEYPEQISDAEFEKLKKLLETLAEAAGELNYEK